MFRIRPLALAAAFVSFATTLPAHAQLPEPVLQVMRTNGIAEDAVSVLVLRGDRTLISHLADRPMQPASTMKLVTTLVSLETLGPVFRGRTELRTTGEVQGETLKGDLILRGGADVDLSSEVLDDMLRSLRYQGIRKIEGRLVVDRQLFNPARTDLGAPPFDESPEAYYNVIPDAAMINKNMLQLDMRSTGSHLKLAMQPALQGVTIGHDMKLVNADCKQWDDGWQLPEAVPQKNGGIKVVLHGTFPKNCNQSYSINVIDRQEYVDRLFRASWKRLGGTMSGAAIEGATPPESRLLAAHVSRTLPEIVRDTNKPSDNLLARLLFLSLGALEADPVLGSRPAAGGAETTLSRSDAVVRNWMRAHGIDDSGLVLENGSGLSRTERITPVQMGGLLQAGLRSNWAPEFQSSMPIVGVDGTMRRRLHDSPAAGRARMKTGTLHNVVALAGYVPDASGQSLVVVALVNSDLAGNGRGRAVLDTLVDWVAHQNGPAQPVLAIPGEAAPAQPEQPAPPAPPQGQDGMQRQPVPQPVGAVQ
ncbi:MULTISPECIES: D-alanyl-D-alanine carboxypeptidase/D-alanyl-D-alanine-endopeptidase [unclassified Massilia]|uniref:D-alanyl-D-alanine carboxypeptidase/D-alanyl-D-alanine endopeptidase n=1 Tax=unclassified Massilia TaxID=2609279 RepID=UPI0009E7B166|nr:MULTISPECIES: D-alanyl-D-alanine carboxypeptidase/D-alanyl-D-alanine-endopeptidase [unclassified Massilia]